jgi:nucleoside-diphosphate-sugar epimerase
VTLRSPFSVKDYIYVDDIAAAILFLAVQGAEGTFNLGAGRGVAVRDIANLIGELMNKPGLIREQPGAERDPLDFAVADSTKLRALGWQPQVSLEEGLRRLVDRLHS